MQDMEAFSMKKCHNSIKCVYMISMHWNMVEILNIISKRHETPLVGFYPKYKIIQLLINFTILFYNISPPSKNMTKCTHYSYCAEFGMCIFAKVESPVRRLQRVFKCRLSRYSLMNWLSTK